MTCQESSGARSAQRVAGRSPPGEHADRRRPRQPGLEDRGRGHRRRMSVVGAVAEWPSGFRPGRAHHFLLVCWSRPACGSEWMAGSSPAMTMSPKEGGTIFLKKTECVVWLLLVLTELSSAAADSFRGRPLEGERYVRKACANGGQSGPLGASTWVKWRESTA